jgi:hypothetical protein
MASNSSSAGGPITTDTPLIKITKQTAEICALFPLSAEGRAQFDPDPALSPAAFLDRLCGEGLAIDAIRFMAHGLPSREAVWWACLAARPVADTISAEETSAIEAAEAWVYRPDEEHRRTAMVAAEAVGNNESPARWAATAAAWSGGSLAPPEAPVVPPGETLTAQAVAGAVLLAAIRREPERAPERHRRAVAQAVDIARGGTGRQAGESH